MSLLRNQIALVFIVLFCCTLNASQLTSSSREFNCSKKYLNLPVSYDAPMNVLDLTVDGKRMRQMQMRLSNQTEPDYWVYLELKEFHGKIVKLTVEDLNEGVDKGFAAIFQGNTFPGQDKLYKEKLRPQFHYTTKRGWVNDTNGLVYYDGEYHMFYQHNPYGWPWGNMTWGHAVSKDLVFWEELGDAIHPDQYGTIFSGGAVVDHKNVSGFQAGKEKPILCFYTYAGGANPWSKGEKFTQAVAYSNDRGRTFTKYEDNPIIGHIRGASRDPKVIWHEPTKKWVMVLYVEENEMDFFTSDDLKEWTKTSRLKSFHECPELFELPVDGNKQNMKWITYGASGEYYIGSFDGEAFKPETEEIKFNYGNAFYASQTFSDIPEEDGRRIMMGWGTVPLPGMPFNQLITFPVELSLRSTDKGVRMFAEPVREIEKLHKKKHRFTFDNGVTGTKILKGVQGDLLHIKAEFSMDEIINENEAVDEEEDEDDIKERHALMSFGLVINGFKISYHLQNNELVCLGPDHRFDFDDYSDAFRRSLQNELPRFSIPHKAELEPENGKIFIEILVDRTFVEVFANHGNYYFPMGAYLVGQPSEIKVFSKARKTKVNQLEVYELKSMWE